MIICKFCGNSSDKSHKGYCISCYQYFIVNNFDTWCPSNYGELNYVAKKDSNQYGMPVCHICGKAFTKLQQHIWYAHDMTKEEYCNKFGIDRNIRMTTDSYNKKMSDYAYKYNMDEQLRVAGKKTRFKKGHNITYKRSAMTMARLRKLGEETIRKNSKYKKEVI